MAELSMAQVGRGRWAGWDMGIVFFVALAAVAAGCVINLAIYDEGLILVGSDLVARGAVPHRDFHANYGPAEYYIIAGLFGLFGKSFWTARMYDLAVRAGILACSYGLMRSRAPASLMAVGMAAVYVLLIVPRAYLYPAYPALLLSLAGTWLISQVVELNRDRWKVLAAGALTGAVALFRYDVGFFVLASHCVAYALRPQRPLREHVRQVLGFGLLYGLGVAAVFLPAAAAMAAAGAGPGFVTDLFGETAIYHATRRLPFPGPDQFTKIDSAVYLPFVVLALALLSPLILRRGTGGEPETQADDRLAWNLGWLTALSIAKGVVRPEVSQLINAIVPAVLLFVLLAPRLWPVSSMAKAAVMLVAVAAFEPVASGLLNRALLARLDPKSSMVVAATRPDPPYVNRASSTLPTTRGARVYVDDLCAAELVHANSSPDEFILSATGRHDRIVSNNISMYFVADRRPATHWFEYDPGWQTRADIQRAMIGELVRKDVRWIVIDRSADNIVEPNDSAKSSGVTLLDRYIADHYRPVATYQFMTVYLRAGEAPPLRAADRRCLNLPEAPNEVRVSLTK